jgi:hypothetical protein
MVRPALSQCRNVNDTLLEARCDILLVRVRQQTVDSMRSTMGSDQPPYVKGSMLGPSPYAWLCNVVHFPNILGEIR